MRRQRRGRAGAGSSPRCTKNRGREQRCSDADAACGAQCGRHVRSKKYRRRPERGDWRSDEASVPAGVFRLPVSSQNDNILPSWRWSVKTITALAAKKLGKFLAKDFRRVFGPAHDDMAERLGAFARGTIECLARSDALYHNYEHTLQVTMVGREILQGMTLSQRIEPTDYSHLIVACLLHDIGYMRGVLSGDTETEFVVDGSGKRITLPRGASDAALSSYHVDRSKLFAFERLRNSPTIDASRIAAAIEMTRFPARPDRTSATQGIEPKLVQAADLIGQLGDPIYPRK